MKTRGLVHKAVFIWKIDTPSTINKFQSHLIFSHAIDHGSITSYLKAHKYNLYIAENRTDESIKRKCYIIEEEPRQHYLYVFRC